MNNTILIITPRTKTLVIGIIWTLLACSHIDKSLLLFEVTNAEFPWLKTVWNLLELTLGLTGIYYGLQLRFLDTLSKKVLNSIEATIGQAIKSLKRDKTESTD